MSLSKKFLLWCSHQHVNFRIPEIESLVSMLKIPFEWAEPLTEEPFLVACMRNEEDARKLMSRTILIRSVHELWAQGTTMKELQSNLQSIPSKNMEPYKEESFRIRVETFGKKISRESKIDKMDAFDFLPFEGPIRLNDPNHQFVLLEYYGMNPVIKPELPIKLFFGRWICDGQKRCSHLMNLRERKFIGNTSMNPMLSLIMANMGKAQPGTLVLDPFVGSGSLLVSSAWFGAHVIGTDINFLMLHGKAKPSRINTKEREPDESIRQNMCQYQLESNYVDVLVADASRPLWRNTPIFDAIITDPPYGIRESTERIGSKKRYKIPEHLAERHIPSKVSYSLQDILSDLLNFSVLNLRISGRLVYWLPVFMQDFDIDCIPSHPSLRLVSYSDQPLTKSSSRFLITMEKISEASNETSASVPLTTCEFRGKYFQQSNS